MIPQRRKAIDAAISALEKVSKKIMETRRQEQSAGDTLPLGPAKVHSALAVEAIDGAVDAIEEAQRWLNDAASDSR